MFFPIENLPDETLLGIFACLEFKDLGRCLQVSKMFRKIALDETLWQTIKTVDEDVSVEFLVQALTHGTKHLSLKSTPLALLFPKRGENLKRYVIYTLNHSDIDLLEFPKQNQLKTLNLNIGGDKKIVSALLDSCQILENLYLTRFSRFDDFKPVLLCITINGKSLRTLNFGDQIELDFARVQIICDNCIELTEFAVYLCERGAVAYLCKNLTTKIRKLRIATPRLCQDRQKQAQENCKILTERCNELIALSITGFDLTIIGITSIMKNLSQSLETFRFCLDIYPWRYLELLPLAELHKFECLPMPNLTKVYVMGLPMTFHLQIQQLLDKKLLHVKVILSNGYPGETKSLSQRNAFLLFCEKHSASVKELYPDLENRQITKILGQSWQQLTLQEKIPFSDKNDVDEIAIPADQLMTSNCLSTISSVLLNV